MGKIKRYKRIVEWDDEGDIAIVFLFGLLLIVAIIMLIISQWKLTIVLSTFIILTSFRIIKKSIPNGKRVYWEEVK